MADEVGAGRELAAQMALRMADDFAARQADEMDRMRSLGFAQVGATTPIALLVKGAQSAQECEGGDLLAGPDGAALLAALAKLGYTADAWAGLSCRVRTSDGWQPADPDDLGWAIEVLDPEVVICCDDEAARAVAQAWELDPVPEPGHVVRCMGRRLLALGGFAEALGDPGGKRVMWERLKLVPPLAEPF